MRLLKTPGSTPSGGAGKSGTSSESEVPVLAWKKTPQKKCRHDSAGYGLMCRATLRGMGRRGAHA